MATRWCTKSQISRLTNSKNRTVAVELRDNTWIRSLANKSTIQELKEFLELWVLLSDVHLQHGSSDTVKWRWTDSGQYSVRTPYLMQFQGNFVSLKPGKIWKAAAEPKCRFYAWLVLHNRTLTSVLSLLIERRCSCHLSQKQLPVDCSTVICKSFSDILTLNPRTQIDACTVLVHNLFF